MLFIPSIQRLLETSILLANIPISLCCCQRSLLSAVVGPCAPVCRPRAPPRWPPAQTHPLACQSLRWGGQDTGVHFSQLLIVRSHPLGRDVLPVRVEGGASRVPTKLQK